MSAKETLEEKVERLEFYIDLLREFATDTEAFVIWDWAIGNRLDKSQVNSIMKVIPEYQLKLLRTENVEVKLLFHEFVADINRILYGNDSETDQAIVFQLLKRVKRMGTAEELVHQFLQLET